jgi:RNase P protein component
VEFRRPRRRAWPGKRLGRVQGLRGNGLGAYSRRRDGRRPGTVGADGSGRGRNHSDELAARADQQANWEATRDPRAVGARRVGGASDRRVEFTVSTNGGYGGSAVRRSLARRTVRRLYRQAPRRLSVFLHTKAMGEVVQAWSGEVTRRRRAQASTSTAARPLVGRRSVDARCVRIGQAGPRTGLGVRTQRTVARR